MSKRNWRITKDPKTGNDNYEETMYHCDSDDVWVTVDLPVANAKQA